MASHLLREMLGAGLAAIVLLRGPVIANAQSSSNPTAPSATNQRAAKKLVDDGIAAMNAKDFDKAIDLYSKAYTLVPHPTLLYNIGLAYKLAGWFDQAETFYQRYLATAPKGPQAEAARVALAEIQAASTALASSTGTDIPTGSPGTIDDEEPSTHHKQPPSGGSGVTVSSDASALGTSAKVYFGLGGGTSFGYVTGKTEFDNEVENCCLGRSLLVFTPELGYYVASQLSLGVAARLGLPIGANLEGRSTMALAGVVRVRYALSRSSEGVRVIGQLGVGILRNTIRLNNAVDGMDTDIVAQGPLLLGVGVGYTKRISGNIALLADLSALAGIAVAETLGSVSNLNNGVSADLSLGVVFGF